MPAQIAVTFGPAAAAAAAAAAVPAGTPTPHTDAWTWVAEYADGTLVHETDDAGYDVRGMAAVDVARVVRFHLVPLREGLPTPTVQLDPAAGQRVIFTRRRRNVFDLGTGALCDQRTVHLLGYQQTVAGKNVKHLTYWFDDGSCLVASDDQAV